MATLAAPTAGWATSVGINARRASSSAAAPKAGGAKMSGPTAGPPPASSTRSNSSKVSRTDGEDDSQLAEHPGRLRTLAGEDERDLLRRPRPAWPRKPRPEDRRGSARPSAIAVRASFSLSRKSV